MKALLTTAAMSFRMFFRDRSSVFWGIAFPLLLMGLIGSVFGRQGGIRLTVSLAGSGPVYEGLQEGFKHLSIVDLRLEDEQTALAALRAGDRSLVVVVPPGMPPITLRVYYDETNPQIAQAGIAVVQQMVAEANRRMTSAPTLLSIATTGVAAKEFRLFDFLLPGIIAMAIMQSSLMGVTSVIAGYRERLVLKRVLATSVSPSAFLAGLVARFTLVNLMQGAIIFLVAVFAFGARTSGQIVEMAVLAVFGSVVFLGMGFAVSVISRTAEAANVLGSVIYFPMMFLSGTFWPKEFMPAGMLPVVNRLPLTPLVDAMRGVGALGEPLTAYGGGVLYLLGWGAAAFALAAWRFRWE